MPVFIRSLAAAALTVALAACAAGTGGTPATTAGTPIPGGHPDSAITVGREQDGKFLSFVGPKTPHDPPFLGVAGTNYDCLRSYLDTRSGEVANQLYVEDSYAGVHRDWSAAQDEAGNALRFIPISNNEITCNDSCAYAEEFAAALPEPLMRASADGLVVTFTGKSGARTVIQVPGKQVAAQLAAIDSARSGLVKPAASAQTK